MARSPQGQGRETKAKEGFARLFRENLAVFHFGKHWSSAYWAFDVTAGSGMNDGGIRGSPLVWFDVASKSPVRNWRAVFVEKDPARASLLRQRAEMADPRCRVETADHRTFICRIPELLASTEERPAYAIGHVLVDPNGYKDMPITQLEWLSQECPRIDLMLNWVAAAMKRWMVFSNNNGNQNGVKYVRLNQALARFNKKYWLIRQPRDAHQFSILLGTNYERKEYRRLGFYDIRSDHGISILDKLSHTEKERNGRVQGSLF